MIVAQNELTLLLFFILIILLAPFMPNKTLLMFDNMLVRIASILLLLFAISQGPSAGLIGLVAIGVIYLERNRRNSLQ